eukprot:CAMPEP_0170515706 /NCGR_PEP_ID=MMETSP0209-20121228/2105_1 /TAXON_ID=665100 ORGANISM="Litonotus pictus, Strain P1" /NCGR_SAMPLE_ID=MMETSP0209 /ASSEMBLY_ACC=CAM_ASM_000301 /LENGTH=263 /DNA_ID=CAMNT_0010800307 /DNA_START=132 /DNA_END=923 /DNA_ORIENTATION=+
MDLRSDNSTFTSDFNLVYENYQAFDNVVLTYKDNLLEVSDKQSLLSGSDNKGYLVFDYRGYLFKYDLEKIVIHLPTEHTIDGEGYDLELEFYHKKDFTYTSEVNKYQKIPDISHYLVISSMYSLDGTNSDSGFLSNLRRYYHPNGVNANSIGMNWDIMESGLIRDKRFYFYSGSDTVYPCSETHLHYVIADIFKIDQATLNSYLNIYEGKYDNTDKIYAKPIATQYGRAMFRNFYNNQTEANLVEGLNRSVLVLALICLLLLL